MRTPRTSSGWYLAAVLVGSGVLGCRVTSTFECDRDEQCRLGDKVGICELNRACTFADSSCANGRRFDDLGPPEVAGTCGGSVNTGANADGHIDQGGPTNAFGTMPTMKVDGNGMGVKAKRSFVSFDLSAIPSDATVLEATLQLCVTGSSAGAQGHQEDLQLVTSTWGEATLSWDTQPTVADSATGSFIVMDKQCVTFDVRVDVQMQVDSATSDGWSVRDHDESSGPSGLDIATHENGEATKRPTLSVTYATR